MSDQDKPEETGKSEREGVHDVLASIRALVSAEAASRLGAADGVLMLTPEMRADAARPEAEADGPGAALLAEGIGNKPHRASAAPILDEEAIRALVNQIVREELQGELGERIIRNMRKMIRRELAELEQARSSQPDRP